MSTVANQRKSITSQTPGLCVYTCRQWGEDMSIAYRQIERGLMALKIFIAGGGIGGLTAALCLKRSGCEVEVFEQASTLGEIGAGVQISPNAMHVLGTLGVVDALEEVAFEPLRASLRHYQSGNPYFSSQMKGFYLERYGAKYLHASRADLIEILSQAVARAGIRVHLQARVTGYEQSRGTIELILQDDTRHEAALLVGADGIHSAVRTAMLGFSNARFTGSTAWRGLVPTERLPANTIAPEANVWLGPGRHFVAYYLHGGTLINFVAVEERNQWAGESWHEKGDIFDVRTAFAGWDEPVTKLLEACEECYLWGLFDQEPLPKWSDGRALLLGDACHAMLPFMAQGAAMAIEDACVLADEIIRQPQNLTEALHAYEHRRKPRTTMMQQVSRANARLFHLSGPGALFVRALKFRLGKIMPGLAATRLDKLYGVNVTQDHKTDSKVSSSG